MVVGMPKVSVDLSPEVHAAVRVRAFREGTSLAELGRRFFEGYGGLVAGAAEGGDGLEQRRPVGGSGRGAVAGEAETQTGVDHPEADSSRHAPATSPRKKCSREARHHINHSGKPCPECGFPK